MPNSNLTKIETEVMEILWKEQRPLTILEITNLAPVGSSWTKSGILRIVNSLSDKELVKHADFVQHNKAYARTFVPTISFEDYTVQQIESSRPFEFGSISKILSGLLNTKKKPMDKQRTIDELMAIINENSWEGSKAVEENTNEN